MSNTINRTRLALVLALVAGVLGATFGLFGTGGPSPVSAQTETGICDYAPERVQDADSK